MGQEGEKIGVFVLVFVWSVCNQQQHTNTPNTTYMIRYLPTQYAYILYIKNKKID